MEPSIFEGLLDPPPGYTPEDMEVSSPHAFFGEQQVSPDEEKQKRAFRLHSKLEDYSERLRAQEEGYLASQFQKMQAQWSEYEQSLRTTRDEIMGELAKPLPKRQPIQLTEGEKIAAGIGAILDPQSAGRTIQEVYGQAEKRNAEEYELALKEDEIRRRNLMMELESEGDLLTAKYKNAQEILTLETNATLKRIAQKTQAHEGAIQGLWEAAASGNPLGVMFAAQQLGLDPNDEDVQALVKQAQEQEALNKRMNEAKVAGAEQAVRSAEALEENRRAKTEETLKLLPLKMQKMVSDIELTDERANYLRLQAEFYPEEVAARNAERYARIWKMEDDAERAWARLSTAVTDSASKVAIADAKAQSNAYIKALEAREEEIRVEVKNIMGTAAGFDALTNVSQNAQKLAMLKKEFDEIPMKIAREKARLAAVQAGQPTGGQPAEGTTKEGITWRVKGNPKSSGGTVNTRGFSRRIETQTNRSQQQTAELIRSRFSGVHGVTDERVLQAILANAYAESGWNPKAVGDAGDSFGLFQANTKGGMGAGHSPAKLKDPTYNIDLIAKSDVFRQFLRFAEQNPNMSARDLTYHFARIVERPAKKYLEKRRQAWDIVFG